MRYFSIIWCQSLITVYHGQSSSNKISCPTRHLQTKNRTKTTTRCGRTVWIAGWEGRYSREKEREGEGRGAGEHKMIFKRSYLSTKHNSIQPTKIAYVASCTFRCAPIIALHSWFTFSNDAGGCGKERNFVMFFQNVFVHVTSRWWSVPYRYVKII